jgi:hypothetical protein
MTDVDHDPEEAAPADGPQAVEDIHAMPDPILSVMAAALSRFESAEIGLTLYLPGLVISGIAVSPNRFFEEMADWLAREGAEDFAENFARPTAEMFRTPDTEPAEEEQDEPSLTDFIHLRAARVFTSGSDRPLPETLWRGRLSHVSGWSLGTMRASKA